MSQSMQKCWQVLLFCSRNTSYCIQILTSLFINKILTKLSQGLRRFSFRKFNNHNFGTYALNSLVTKLKKLVSFGTVSIANIKRVLSQKRKGLFFSGCKHFVSCDTLSKNLQIFWLAESGEQLFNQTNIWIFKEFNNNYIAPVMISANLASFRSWYKLNFN